MSFIASLFQSPTWRFVEELTSPLFKSPEWNFAHEVAANPLNRNIKLASVSRAITEQGMPAFDPVLVFARTNFSYDFVSKFSTPLQMLDARGQIFEVYYKKAPVPTPFHLINNRLVASVKIITSESKENVSAVFRGRRLRVTDEVVQIEQNKNFSAQISIDISNWNAAMQLKLMTIFLSCIAFGAMIPILVVKITFIALTAFTAMRLLQLYSLQKKNAQIVHVGHWVAQLWQAFSLNPMLRRQYGHYFDDIFFSEPKVLEPTAAAKRKDQNKTAEKKPPKSLGIKEYHKYCDDFRRFADPLISKECETREEQHKWVADFFSGNPFATDFFKDKPELEPWPPEEKWKRIELFQFHYAQLKQQYDNLALSWPTIQKRQAEAKRMCGEKKYELETKVQTAVLTLSLDEQVALQYQSLLLQAFEEEYSSKITELVSVTNEQKGSLIYSQAGDFFVKVCNEIVWNKSCIIIPVSLQKVIADFQDELDKPSQEYPQNVVAKAKTLSPDPAFHRFVDHVFKPG